MVKKFCTYCNKKQPLGYFCYVAPLKPIKAIKQVFVRFLPYGVYTSPWKPWRVFWECSKPHMSSADVL